VNVLKDSTPIKLAFVLENVEPMNYLTITLECASALTARQELTESALFVHQDLLLLLTDHPATCVVPTKNCQEEVVSAKRDMHIIQERSAPFALSSAMASSSMVSAQSALEVLSTSVTTDVDVLRAKFSKEPPVPVNARQMK